MMRINSKKTVFRMTAVGGMSLLVAAAIAPGAIAAGTIGGDVKVSNTETVQVLMDPSGKIASQRVYDQLVLTGKGRVDLANPVSTNSLRNLDGFGGYDVRDGKVRVKTDVDGTKKFRSVSNFTKKLPLDISVGYFLDGKKVQPGDVVGKSGNLEVRYRVTNNTGVDEEVPFKDGKGNDKTAKESVVIPMVGSLTTTLPSNFTKVKSKEANAAGDGRGGTSLSFTMTLIPPIGKNYADFGYTAQVKDGIIPKATISALPINPLESPSFSGAAASYQGGAETGADLTAGATEIDANVLKLRDGANKLVTGLLQLQAGAGQLSAGLNNDAAPGARKLADGANQLDAGAGKLKAGTGDLKGGAGDLNAGAQAISDGLSKIRAGVNASGSSPGLVSGTAQLAGGLSALDTNLALLRDGVSQGTLETGGKGLDNAIIPGVQGAIYELTKIGQTPDAFGGLQALAYVRDKLLAPLIAALAGDPRLPYAEGAYGLVDGVHSKLAGPAGVDGLRDLETGLLSLSTTISGSIGVPTDPSTGPAASLRGGVDALSEGANALADGAPVLVDGVNQLGDGAKKLQDGTNALVDGATKLNSGAGALSAGTGQLSAGAGKLSDGLGAAAVGSGKIADGLNQAAASAPALPEGADRLSKEGTSKLIEAGDETASDYGLKYALIAAGANRSATAQPYGSPEGATELTAYKFELAGADGSGSANAKRGIAAIALLAGTAGIAGIRRKGLI